MSLALELMEEALLLQLNKMFYWLYIKHINFSFKWAQQISCFWDKKIACGIPGHPPSQGKAVHV